jgi:membrane protein required for colicin V production
MNYIDLVLGIILIVAIIRGFRNGLIIELASLASLILGIWGAVKFSDWFASFLEKTTGLKSDYTSLIAFIVIFIGIVILIHVLGKVLDTVVNAVALGFINRLAGIVFSLLKTAVILCVLILIIDHVDENVHLLPSQQKAESKLYKPMKKVVPTLLPFIKLWDLDKEKDPKIKPVDISSKPKTT